MHCSITLACIALCAAILRNTDGFPRSVEVIPNGPSLSFWYDQELKDSINMKFRQRRSVWSRFVNHINAVVDTFRMKPVLVGNVESLADNFGNKFENALGAKSKSSNIMLNEFPGPTQEQFTASKWFAQEKNRIKDPVELEKARKDMFKISDMHKAAVTVERELIQYLIDNCKKNHPPDNRYVHLLMKGISRVESEVTLKEIIKSNPELKEKLLEGVNKLIKMRGEMQKFERNFTKYTMLRLTQEELNYEVYNDINLIRFFNDNWLEFVRDQKIYTSSDSFKP